MFYQGLIVPDHAGHEWRGSAVVRHVFEFLAIVGLCAGLYLYLAFIQTVPECAVENHHGAGNCPGQLLRWYPESKITKW
jgi:hypothetical protein